MTLNTNKLEKLIKEGNKNAIEINLAKQFLFTVKENKGYKLVYFWHKRYNTTIINKTTANEKYNQKIYHCTTL